jgi:hypothetical protein
MRELAFLLPIEAPARCRASSQIRTEELAAISKALRELGNAILGNCRYVWRVWRRSSKAEILDPPESGRIAETGQAPILGRHLVYGFLATAPNAIGGPIHPKATPVILTTEIEGEVWMRAPYEAKGQLPVKKVVVFPKDQHLKVLRF